MEARNVQAVHGPTNPSPDESETPNVRRVASVIGLNPDREAYYRELHANAWPSVIERLRRSNVRNFSIYTAELEGRKYLFSYFEYVGEDFDADMQAVALDPETQRWWRETEPCQIPLPNRQPGAQWSEMERVFLLG